MAFLIRMGQPEMESLWLDLTTRRQQGQLDKDEEKFFKKLVKALGYLQENPRHNSLASHEIDEVLGLGSGLNLPPGFPRQPRPQDLFRYSAPGTRSYTTSTSATSSRSRFCWRVSSR